jgi:glycosyltransferase involved in cell wall biosynthesis
MKSSLPVVVADLPDLKYLVSENRVGVTFKAGESKDLTRVLEKIISGKLRSSNYRTNIRIIAHKFTLKVISDRILSLVKASI